MREAHDRARNPWPTSRTIKPMADQAANASISAFADAIADVFASSLIARPSARMTLTSVSPMKASAAFR
ncbi:hypothetical protein D3C71_2123430 [compost metagenome]